MLQTYRTRGLAPGACVRDDWPDRCGVWVPGAALGQVRVSCATHDVCVHPYSRTPARPTRLIHIPLLPPCTSVASSPTYTSLCSSTCSTYSWFNDKTLSYKVTLVRPDANPLGVPEARRQLITASDDITRAAMRLQKNQRELQEAQREVGELEAQRASIERRLQDKMGLINSGLGEAKALSERLATRRQEVTGMVVKLVINSGFVGVRSMGTEERKMGNGIAGGGRQSGGEVEEATSATARAAAAAKSSFQERGYVHANGSGGASPHIPGGVQ